MNHLGIEDVTLGMVRALAPHHSLRSSYVITYVNDENKLCNVTWC